MICFGEVLWDMLPAGKKPGGAPMNVAYHLNRLGVDAGLISRVGCDAEGDELLAFLHSIGISTSFVQKDSTHTTSQVLVQQNEVDDISYDIVAPVAWDFIAYENGIEDLIVAADVFVYGSLVARNKTSRDTLLALLDKMNHYRLFDVNLRSPHYTPETVGMLLQRADAVKLNVHEIAEVSSWLGVHSGTEEEIVAELQEQYNLKEVIVTKGANGASYYTSSARYDCPAVPVAVKDTVGSGDSFLAAFLAMKLRGGSSDQILPFATALGAYVATQDGACPSYSKADFDRFLQKSGLNISA